MLYFLRHGSIIRSVEKAWSLSGSNNGVNTLSPKFVVPLKQISYRPHKIMDLKMAFLINRDNDIVYVVSEP